MARVPVRSINGIVGFVLDPLDLNFSFGSFPCVFNFVFDDVF